MPAQPVYKIPSILNQHARIRHVLTGRERSTHRSVFAKERDPCTHSEQLPIGQARPHRAFGTTGWTDCVCVAARRSIGLRFQAKRRFVGCCVCAGVCEEPAMSGAESVLFCEHAALEGGIPVWWRKGDGRGEHCSERRAG